LAISSVLITVAALRFLYTVTLKRTWRVADIILAPKKPQRLPIVLSPEEVLQFLAYSRRRGEAEALIHGQDNDLGLALRKRSGGTRATA
jgi:hypothetical protein